MSPLLFLLACNGAVPVDDTGAPVVIPGETVSGVVMDPRG